MRDSYEIEDKIAFITGANRGIGREIVDAFIRNGVRKIYAAVRDLHAAKHLVESNADKVELIELDLTKPSTILAAARLAPDTDIVVNSAGVLRTTTSLDETAVESLELEIDVNVLGLIRLAQAFAPVLERNGGGVFIQLNSVASMKCFAGLTTYCASKAAAYTVAQSLRDLWKAKGIKVMSVHPGPMATDMGTAAGLADIAEPPQVVADAIVCALATDEFHVFPGSMAETIGAAYASYAKAIVDVDLMAESSEAAAEEERLVANA